MEKFCEIISKKLTWEEILKYDKYFLSNPAYVHQLKKFIDKKNTLHKEK